MPYSRRAITRRCRVGICAPAYIAGAIATRSSCNFFVVVPGASSHCAIVGRVCSNRSYRPRQVCRRRGLSGDALVLPPRPAMPCCPKTQEAIRGGNAIRCFAPVGAAPDSPLCAMCSCASRIRSRGPVDQAFSQHPVSAESTPQEPLAASPSRATRLRQTLGDVPTTRLKARL